MFLDGVRNQQNSHSDSGSASRFFQQCPPDPVANPCLTCQDCVTEDEQPAGVFTKEQAKQALETRQGRYPANLLWDGSDEVEAEFAKAGKLRQSSSIGIKKTTDFSFTVGKAKDQKEQSIPANSYGSAARFFQQCPPDPLQHPDAARFHYCSKAGPKERTHGNHPTVKPLSLIRYLCRLTKTPTGGLDPFAGSGTTGVACLAEGRDYILIEQKPEYVDICKRRIAEYTGETIAPKEIELKDEEVTQLGLW
jgi:DNA modification methylase